MEEEKKEPKAEKIIAKEDNMPKEKEKESEVEKSKKNTSEEKAVVKPTENVTDKTALAATTAVVATAAIATATVLSTIEEEKQPSVEVPIKGPSPPATIVVEPLKKVSEARKSFEPSKFPVETEIKSAPIIIAEIPKSAEPLKTVEPQRAVEFQKAIEQGKSPEPEAKAIPIIIAEAPNQKEEVKVPEKEPKIIQEVEEITAAPPPLPTDNAHLLASRESLKPSLLPVMPVNGAPSSDLDAPKPQTASSPLATSAITADELEQLRKELDEQKLALEREIDCKKALESQIQAIISKSNAQEEALKYKNESLEQLHSDYLKTNNDLTSARNEKEKLEAALTKAEEELATISESNAKSYLEKSEEVTELKDKLAEFAAIIGQKNKEIDSLQRQLDEVKRSNVNTALENVHQYEKIEDELMKMVEEEILRMQDTIDEQREYNAKLQMEVDAEYAYWKRRLEEVKKEGEVNNT